jgi:hypothetical protein
MEHVHDAAALEQVEDAVEVARSFLPDDPLTGRDRLEQLERSLRRQLADDPEPRPELTQLLQYVSDLAADAREQARRWQARCTEREQHFHTWALTAP